jgi:para-nitrobenzyl esterase
MKRFLIVLVVLGAIAAALYGGLIWMITKPAPSMAEGPIVSLSLGEIMAGVDRDNEKIVQVNGIPFAAPPVGDLRWAAPQAAPSWDGVRDGREFGAECLQNREGSGEFLGDLLDGLGLNPVQRHLATVSVQNAPPPVESEDCLFLNVRTENLGAAELRPVMVWIHGGSHQSGSGAMDLYNSNALVENGTVLVTINYRLGPLGYMAHPALSAADPRGVSGNYGLLDQIAALEWVRDNIAAFGGDPSNVTIFGESAGAQSVTEIMSSPQSKGLFHKAILQSGASSYNANALDAAINGRLTMHEAGIAFMDGLAAADASAADLRAISGEALMAHIPSKGHLSGYLLPTVDGVVIPKLMGRAIADGSIHNVPILAGYNADEATLFYPSIQKPTVLVPEFPISHEDKLAKLNEIYGVEDALVLVEQYGLADPENWDNGALDMLGDDLFGVHMRYLARANTEQGEPSYLYHFTRVTPTDKQTLGAFHASEIFFVFDSHTLLLGLTDEEKVLTEAMGQYWANFAKTGNPNSEGLVEWPAYDSATDLWMTFNPSIEVKSGVRAEKLDVMERALVKNVDLAYAQVMPELETQFADAASGSQESGADSLEP